MYLFVSDLSQECSIWKHDALIILTKVDLFLGSGYGEVPRRARAGDLSLIHI